MNANNMMSKFNFRDLAKQSLNKLISLYVALIYKPLNNTLHPFFLAHPLYPWVTPNRVTVCRTFLLVPTIICLLLGHVFLAFFLVMLNDFCDIIDGIVYRAHTELHIKYDNRFGAFIDAVCDKIFIVSVWYAWLIIEIVHHGFALAQFIIVTLMLIESVLFWRRVELYYSNMPDSALSASSSGKAKQTFEMLGTAFLFVLPSIGYCILFLAIFLACKSYIEKKNEESPASSAVK